MSSENFLRKFCTDEIYLQDNYRGLLRIAQNYELILTALFEFAEEIPRYAIHFVLNGSLNEYGQIFSSKVATITKGSQSLEFTSYETPGILLNGIRCYFVRDNYSIAAFFEIPLTDENSILKYVTRHFFSKMIDNIMHYSSVFASVNHEESIYIAYAVTEYFLHRFLIDVNFINSLSAETYEGNHTNSKIYIASFGNYRGKRGKSGLKISFENPIQFIPSNTRQIRKLLEISNGSLALVISSKVPKPYSDSLPERNDGYHYRYDWPLNENNRFAIGFSSEGPKSYEDEIIFNGFMSWDYISQNYTVKYRKGRYLFSYVGVLTEETMTEKLTVILDKANSLQISRLLKVVLEANKQKHGTILLISSTETVKSEVKRLKKVNRAIMVKPIDMIENIEYIH